MPGELRCAKLRRGSSRNFAASIIESGHRGGKCDGAARARSRSSLPGQRRAAGLTMNSAVAATSSSSSRPSAAARSPKRATSRCNSCRCNSYRRPGRCRGPFQTTTTTRGASRGRSASGPRSGHCAGRWLKSICARAASRYPTRRSPCWRFIRPVHGKVRGSRRSWRSCATSSRMSRWASTGRHYRRTVARLTTPRPWARNPAARSSCLPNPASPPSSQSARASRPHYPR